MKKQYSRSLFRITDFYFREKLERDVFLLVEKYKVESLRNRVPHQEVALKSPEVKY